jgi:colanic acid/amylovoran biosynthesis glycosyltransferase
MTKQLKTGHYHPIWLPNTMTWLHRQLVELNSYSETFVYCEKVENESEFPIQRIRNFESASKLIQFRDRLAKKTGISPGLPTMLAMMGQDQIQILHSHFGHIGIVGARMATSLDIPHLVSFYGMDIHQIPKRYPHIGAQYANMFETSKLILCEGSVMAQSLINLGAPPEKVLVHPLGIELEFIQYHSRFWTPASTLKILIAASFRPKKGITDALEAISRIDPMVSCEVTIVGDAGLDQTSLLEKDRILRCVERLNLSDRIHFLGFKSHRELLDLAKHHHVYIQPSLHAEDGDCEGGVPVTLIELAAQGITVISTKHCDIPGVIVDGVSGWLAAENNFIELAEVLNKAIEHHQKWPEMSKEARAHIEMNYDAQKQGLRLYHTYLEVLL